MTVSINGTSGLSLGTGSVTFPDASTQNTAATGFGFKNRIINGAMMIDQRNAGASVTPTNLSYNLDRWGCLVSQASKFTVQQNAGAVTPPVGFSNYLGVTSSSAYSVLTGDRFVVYQTVEGFNAADLAWGTANAQTVTLSFQVRSSLTGTFSGCFRTGSGTDYSYPFTYSIPVANTWTTVSVTVAGPAVGTWNSTNGLFAYVAFSLGVGSTYSGTAGSWTAGNLWGNSSAVSIVGTSGATFYITGVQLEKGSTATSFDYRPYGTELALCQRYYEIQGYAADALTVSGVNYGVGAGNMNYRASQTFAVVKRASPTVSIVGTWSLIGATAQPTIVGASPSNYTLNLINSSTSGQQIAGTTTTSGIAATSEL